MIHASPHIAHRRMNLCWRLALAPLFQVLFSSWLALFCLTLVPSAQEQKAEDEAIKRKLTTGASIGNGDGEEFEENTAEQKGEEQSQDDGGEGSSDDHGVHGAAASMCGKPNVDAAINALKADKEKERSRKVLKQITKDKNKNKKPKSAAAVAKERAQQEAKPTLELDECDDFKPTISNRSSPQDSRVKTALDDFLCSIRFARMNLPVKIPDDEASRSKHFLVSLFLELAWTSSVAVNGKIFKTYSSFRDECQKVFVAAHQRIQIGKESFDPLHLAKNLMSMVNTPASHLQRV